MFLFEEGSVFRYNAIMPTHKTQGIIIKRRNFGEADRLLTIFTKDFGKISAIAKGVRKPLSKLGGHLELFYLTDFVLSEGRNFYTITGAEMVEDFSNLRINSNFTNLAYYLSELTIYLSGEDQKEFIIYELLKKSLYYINLGKYELVLPYYTLQLLSEIGHKPELDLCVKCHKNLIKGLNYFSVSLGGIICPDCQKYDLQSQSISTNGIKIIRLLLSDNIEILDKFKVDTVQIKEVNQIFYGFAEGIAEKKINSIRFIK